MVNFQSLATFGAIILALLASSLPSLASPTPFKSPFETLPNPLSQKEPRNRAPATQKGGNALNRQLVRATEKGQVREMRRLLKLGADANYRGTNIFRYPLLLVATLAGKPESVQVLLNAGANPDARDSRGTPLLVSASGFATNDLKGHAVVQCIQLILKSGKVNANARDSAQIGDDRGALHSAAANGSLELVKALLQAGADPNERNRYSETPVYFASERGHLEIARALMEHGADADIRTRFTKMSPVMAAAEAGHDKIVRWLVARNADIRAKNAFGKSPLQLARISLKKASRTSPPCPAQCRRLRETVRILERAVREQDSGDSAVASASPPRRKAHGS